MGGGEEEERGREGGIEGGGTQKSLEPLQTWWLVVATQDGGPVLTLLGRRPGGFLTASRVRSRVAVLLEAFRVDWGF